MLVRAASVGLEVFMLRRSAKSAFVPDVYVFPGGGVDPDDFSPELHGRIKGLASERMREQFRAAPTPLLQSPEVPPPSADEQRALLVSAMRELFEEAGVLLGVDPTPSAAKRALVRERLLAGRLTFAQALDELDCTIDANHLEFFSQWITPPGELARRFNAHFFLARGDDEQGVADRFETHDERWISPQDALEGYYNGTFAMVYPTIKHIERLTEFANVDEALAFAKRKPILQIMPYVTGRLEFSLPPELERMW